MKKISIFCLFLFVLASCESDDGSLRAELIPILSVQAPDQMIVGQRADFLIQYDRPSSCHGFLRFDVAARDNNRTVGLIAGKIGNDCQPLDEIPREIIFDVVPNEPGFFSFRFFSGKDNSGEDTFIIFAMEVIANPNR